MKQIGCQILGKGIRDCARVNCCCIKDFCDFTYSCLTGSQTYQSCWHFVSFNCPVFGGAIICVLSHFHCSPLESIWLDLYWVAFGLYINKSIILSHIMLIGQTFTWSPWGSDLGINFYLFSTANKHFHMYWVYINVDLEF